MKFHIFILKYLNRLVPKSNKNIVLYNSMLYQDNICALLKEYNGGAHVNHKFIVLCESSDITYPGVISKNVYKLKSFFGVFYLMRARYLITDQVIIPDVISDEQIVINIWHGLGLKKICAFENDLIKKKRKNYYADYAVAYSDFFSKITAKAFNVKLKNVLSVGSPRNDYFYSRESKWINDFFVEQKKKFQKVIIWMPTYRQSDKASSKNDGHDYEYGIPLLNCHNIKKLNEVLRENGILLEIKYHVLQNNQHAIDSEYSNINILTSKKIEELDIPLYEFIGHCDALISDYSSIYIEYLALDRPICFAYDDMEEYENKRGFMFENVLDIMPGHHARKVEELYDFIRDVGDNIDRYKEVRNKVRTDMQIYCDNKNSERLLKALEQIFDE